MKFSSMMTWAVPAALALSACGSEAIDDPWDFHASPELSAPALSLPRQAAIITSRTVAFSGRSDALAGSRVIVTATDATLMRRSCTATVSSGQTWSCSQDLPDGGYTWTAQVDPAGPVSAPIDFVVFTSGFPAPTIDHTISPTRDPSPILTGTVSSSLLGKGRFFLEVSETGKVLCTVNELTSAQWSCALPKPLSDGLHLLTADVGCGTACDDDDRFDGHEDTHPRTSPSSNPDLFLVKTSIAIPTVLPIPTPTGVNRPSFSGTGEPAALVTVAESSAIVCQAQVTAGGRWACSAADALADGSHTISVTQADAAGNISGPATVSFVIDTHVPVLAAPILDAPRSPTRDSKPLFSGMAQPGVLVAVLSGETPICTATADSGGRWSCRPASALPDGSYLLVAQVSDGRGHSSAASAARALVVDTVPPAAPVWDHLVSPTRKHRPVVSGTAEPGSTVTVTAEVGIRAGGFAAGTASAICEAIANGAGAFSCAPKTDLPAGTVVFTATAADAAGNVSAPAVLTIRISDVAPPTPSIEFPANGAEVEESRPTISGRTAPGTSVQVTLDGVAYSAQVDPDGTWRLQPPKALALGAHQITASATDAELNVSDPAASSFSLVASGFARGGCSSGGVPWPGLVLLAFLWAKPRRRRALEAAEKRSAAGYGRGWRRAAALSLALAVAALPGAARAQAPSIDVSLFRPAAGGDGFAAVEGARPPLPGESRLELRTWSDFAVHPLVFVAQSGSQQVIVRSRAGGWLGVQAHLLGPLSVAAQVPLTYAESGDLSSLPPSSRGPSSLLGGFGDLRITPRLALLRQEQAGIDLATQISFELPTARAQTLTDDGRVRAEGLVALGRRLGEVARGSLDLIANAYLRLRPPRDFLDVKLGNEAGLRAGLGYALPVARAWLPRKVYAEMEGRTFLRAGFAPGTAPAEWRLGMTVCPVRSLAIDLAGGGALTDGVGAPRARFLLGFGWSPSSCGPAAPAPQQLAAAVPPPAPPPPPSPPPPEQKIVQVTLPDRDGDGIPDDDDSCPDQAGPASNHGCPDSLRALVVVAAARIEILEQVQFATAKSRIEPRSHPLLDQVAAVLNSHPDLLLVQVEGHTDNRGNAIYNILLSQARAEAVAAYLESKGVASSRLRARGFGFGRPIADNSTAEGRAANRRVAFSVLLTRPRVIEAQRPPES